MTDINDVIALLRTHLVNDIAIKTLLNNKNAIYLISKPQEEDVNPYICFVYKPLGGRYIQDCQIEFRLVGKDLSKLVALKSRLTRLLNYNRDSQIIRNEKAIIRDSKLLTGGGQLINPATGNYELVVFFMLKY